VVNKLRAVIWALCLVGTASGAQAPEPIRIGIVTELTGKNALAGQQARRGAQLAVEDIAGEGGIHGRRFEVLIEDSASNNAGAVNAFNKLAARGDLAGLIAPLRSTQVLAALPRINEIGLPTITGATNELITRLGCRWIFRNRTNDGLAAQLAVVYAIKKLGARRIGILHDTDAFGTGGRIALTNALRDLYNIEPVAVEKYNTGDRDYTGQLLNLRNAGCDLVISYCTNEPDIGLILRRYRQLGMPYKWLGSPSSGTSISLNITRRAADGIYVFTDFSPERATPRGPAYGAEFRRRFGMDPDLAATQIYDALQLFAQALRRVAGRAAGQSASGIDPEALRQALLETRHVGVAGPFYFDQYGNGRHDEVIATIENARQKPLEVIDESAIRREPLPAGSVPPAPPYARWATAGQLVLEGIALGSIYALVALGFVLLYNAANLVNFAQGELVMVAGYLLATLATRIGPLPGLLVVLAVMAAGSVVFRRCTYDPIAELAARDFTAFIVTTLGASIFLKNLARLIWGAEPALVDSPFGHGSLELAGIFMPTHEAGIVAITAGALTALYIFFQRTMVGVRLRAVAQDRETAGLMGIPVKKMIAIAFAGAVLLGGLGGVLLAPVYFVHPEVGSAVSLKAFSASIVGGFGSVPGAILGGLLLGVAEQLAGAYISQAFRDGIAFVLLILVLIFKPSGLFGEKSGERA
jgi:branched-subunit amino acid ABC-type transport system permease component/ABC-type branched-subunit amino acid transport system substrate-binding protein